jgi:hypothetical protein
MNVGGDGTAQEPNNLSALTDSVRSDGFIIDGGVETRPAEKKKDDPLPKFLKLSRSGMQTVAVFDPAGS